jgi:DNA-binding NarL/FixJ family response regulator
VIRVVLGEDSYLAREGMTRALEASRDVELVGTYGDFDSLRAAVDELDPDVVVTDIRMPPTNSDEGIRLARELRRSHPETGVVLVSQYDDPFYATSFFESGAERRAFLLKERVREADDLGRAVHEVAAGGSTVDPRLVDTMLSVQRRRGNPQLASLTPRELQILGMLAEGWNNTRIAEVLVLTRRTVEAHVSSIFSKLDLRATDDVSPRVRAVLLYLASGTTDGRNRPHGVMP